MQRQAALLTALSDEVKAQLDRGEYPPYHLVNAARRATGVTADAARDWLQALLYWRAHSLPIMDRPDAEPGAAPDTAT
ncbi:MAG TPA: hypothetical protein VGE74_11065 [Gemmata sp.]